MTTNIYYEAIKNIADFLNSNVEDINATRKALLTVNERQWIFPDKPSDKTQYFPKLALKPESSTIEEIGADKFLNEGDTSENRAVNVILPLTIYCFVKRNDKHIIKDYDNVENNVKNSRQADFLADRIFTKLSSGEAYAYFSEKKIQLKVLGLEAAYIDSDFLYASEISVELKMLKILKSNYTDYIEDLQYGIEFLN